MFNEATNAKFTETKRKRKLKLLEKWNLNCCVKAALALKVSSNAGGYVLK